jgi:hypothetical protein
MKVIVGDIVKMEEARKAFRGVDCVIHCAAMVSYQFPPDHESLDRVNVTGQIITQTGPLSCLCVIPLTYNGKCLRVFRMT